MTNFVLLHSHGHKIRINVEYIARWQYNWRVEKATVPGGRVGSIVTLHPNSEEIRVDEEPDEVWEAILRL